MAQILVVDDTEEFRQLIAHALAAEGYVVHCAESGAEALDYLRRSAPDLILLDIRMPGLDGLDVLRAARADKSLARRPVILLTSLADRQAVIKAGRLGVKEYLLKSSVSRKELVERVRRVLRDGADVGNAEDAPAALSAGAPTTIAKPHFDASDLRERLKTYTEGKALAPMVCEVVRLVSDPNGSIDDVCKVVRSDPAMALRVLRLANSAAYSRGKRMDSVDRAVIRIGLKAIGETVLAMSVIDCFEHMASDAIVKPRLIWEHSIGCGLIAAHLASAIDGADRGGAFTMGLLHDVGQLIYADILGDDYDRLARYAVESQESLECVESDVLRLDHAEAMNIVSRGWRIPDHLAQSIALHHCSLDSIRRSAPARFAETAALALANRLAHALMIGSSANDTIYPTHDFCRELCLAPAVIRKIESRIHGETDDFKIGILAASGSDRWTDARADLRQRLAVPFRPVFASACAEYDAIRMFCERLADESGPRNIGVIHLTEARDRLPVSVAFREAERQAGAKDLPVVVLSPKGLLRPDALLGKRRSVLLPSTLTVGRLLDGIRSSVEMAVAS